MSINTDEFSDGRKHGFSVMEESMPFCDGKYLCYGERARVSYRGVLFFKMSLCLLFMDGFHCQRFLYSCMYYVAYIKR